MARTARDKDAFGTYYITQRSSGCRPLFNSDEDRTYFIGILQKTVNKFNCRIIEYCVQSNDTYHLIIDVNGGDLSKIMKSINIPYAMHVNCETKLFKDRYKSNPIHSSDEMEEIRHTIRSATCGDSGFSSFCISEMAPCFDTAKECTQCMSCEEQAYEHLTQAALELKLTIPELLKDKPTRNRLIKEFRRSSTLSLKTIGTVFGGLSESTVSKILNS